MEKSPLQGCYKQLSKQGGHPSTYYIPVWNPCSQWEKTTGIFLWFSLQFLSDSYGFLTGFLFFLLLTEWFPFLKREHVGELYGKFLNLSTIFGAYPCILLELLLLGAIPSHVEDILKSLDGLKKGSLTVGKAQLHPQIFLSLFGRPFQCFLSLFAKAFLGLPILF